MTVAALRLCWDRWSLPLMASSGVGALSTPQSSVENVVFSRAVLRKPHVPRAHVAHQHQTLSWSMALPPIQNVSVDKRKRRGVWGKVDRWVGKTGIDKLGICLQNVFFNLSQIEQANAHIEALSTLNFAGTFTGFWKTGAPLLPLCLTYFPLSWKKKPRMQIA